MQRAHEYGKSWSTPRRWRRPVLREEHAKTEAAAGDHRPRFVRNPESSTSTTETRTREAARQQAAEDEAQAKRDKLAAERSAKYKESGRVPGFAKAK